MKDCDPTEIRSALSVFDKFSRALTFMLLALGKEAEQPSLYILLLTAIRLRQAEK